MLKSIRNILLIFLFIVSFFLMKSLASILLPLIFATLLVIVYRPLMTLLRRYRFPSKLIVPIIAVLTLVIIMVIINIFVGTISDFVSQSDFLLAQMYKKIEVLMNQIERISNSRLQLDDMKDYIADFFNQKTISTALSSIAYSLGNFGKSFFMFALYFVILLGGMVGYDNYILYVVQGKKELINQINSLQSSVSLYITIKIIISALTGTLVYIICISFGLQFALFFGFITFILNFIPSIGSIIATFPPVIMAFIQFDTFNKAIIILILLGIIQLTIGNFIEPKIMGNKLRINTVTVIFGLVFWGTIWGIPGMLLSVPFLVILKLIFENSDSLSVIARIMGTNNKME